MFRRVSGGLRPRSGTRFLGTSKDSRGSVHAVLGAQWGDEGKGKLIDLLAKNYSLVARFNGGANAGHTISVGSKKFFAHQVPSGILNPDTANLIGHGAVVDLEGLAEELVQFKDVAYEGRLFVSDRAHIVLPTMKLLDRAREAAAKSPIGTTMKGIGPCYASKALREGVRVHEAKNSLAFAVRIRDVMTRHIQAIDGLHCTSTVSPAQLEMMVRDTTHLAHDLFKKNMVVDGVGLVRNFLDRDLNVLAEGANGALLDIDNGTYPFVTSSATTVGGILAGLGVSHRDVGEVYGVVKAYVTRVGGGPMPTELTTSDHDGQYPTGGPDAEIGTFMQLVGKEIGVTTGRKRRCGWLDAVALRHAVRLNGYTALNLSKLDVLDTLPYVRICVAYKHKRTGEMTQTFPSSVEELAHMVPQYETFHGWRTKTQGLQELPTNARTYVNAIEAMISCPVKWIGTGPGREDMICRA